MFTEELASLESLHRMKSTALELLHESQYALEPFQSSDYGIVNKGSEHTIRSHETTSTAFCLFYLNLAISKKGVGSLPMDLVKTFSLLIGKYRPGLIDSFEGKYSNIQDPVSIINNYSTPIHICGLLATHESNNIDDPETPYLKAIADLLMNKHYGFINKVQFNNGYLTRIDVEANSVPSPYFTYWIIEAICLYDQRFNKETLNEVYNIVFKWAIDSLAKTIAYTHSGLIHAFDAIEVAYLILISTKLLEHYSVKRQPSNSIYVARKIIEHSTDTLFNNYFSEGCFNKSLPVFSINDYILSCATIEPLALLIFSKNSAFLEYHSKFEESFNWIFESKFRLSDQTIWQWRSEWDHHSNPPTSFLATSVLTYLSGYYGFLTQLLYVRSSDSLSLQKFKKDLNLETFHYPAKLKEYIDLFIVTPLTKGERKYAHLSVILFGPPGTSKSTVAQKLAQELGWPILTLNTNNFLKSGIDRIDSEADHIFRLLSYLENVVVLFDEVEELVLDRDSKKSKVNSSQNSRLLTTSMLPKINDLRSKGKIIFIFATNYIDHIDNAISRTGRFDAVRCILPPTSDERRTILSLLIKQNNINDETTKKLLLDPVTVEKVDRYCYTDLRDLIRRLIIRNIVEKKNKQVILNKEIKVGHKATISETELLKFNRVAKKLVRP